MGVISSLKGLFYPPKCVICGNILPFDTKTSFCPDCAAELSKAIGRKAGIVAVNDQGFAKAISEAVE